MAELRQAENQVTIEGVLVEVRHQEWKSGKGLGIELDIQVAENEVHTVYGMSSYTKKDGSENGIAKGYQTVIDEYKSVKEHGKDAADKVRVTQGQIGLNEFYTQDGQLISRPQINSNFFNRLGATDDFSPKAEFDVEMVVNTVTEEVKNDEETGRVKLSGFIPAYGGKVIPFDFVVFAEGAEYVMDNYEKGNTVKVSGEIVNFKETKVVEEEKAFGKPKEKVTYKTVREYLVTAGSEPYEEDNAKAFDVNAIAAALVERETYLAELKNRNNNNDKKEEKKGGFGGGKKPSETKKAKISSDDLPF